MRGETFVQEFVAVATQELVFNGKVAPRLESVLVQLDLVLDFESLVLGYVNIVDVALGCA